MNFGFKIKRELILFVALLVSFQIQPTANPPFPKQSVPFSESEFDTAEQTALNFCRLWKMNELDSMYQILYVGTRSSFSVQKFKNVYGKQDNNTGKLVKYRGKNAVQNEDAVVVKVTLSFDNEGRPPKVNGVHSIHLVRENKQWKIKTIVPPIAPPVGRGSGGHPGE